MDRCTNNNCIFTGSTRIRGIALLALTQFVSSASAADYFIDCASSENGSGTKASPWNTVGAISSHTQFLPGDSIYFKRGVNCTLPTGTDMAIKPKGSGTNGSVITMDSYGEGSNPAIIVQNFNDEIIVLDNVSYWTIKNLTLIGDGAGTGAFGAATNGRQRRGILVLATSADVTGITLQNLQIKDVIGQDTKFGEGSAGILFYNKDESNYEFHDITIQYNTLSNIHRGAIEFATAIQSEVSLDSQPFTLNPDKKSKNIRIRRNTLYRIGGDGIVLDGTDGAIVEWNILNVIANRSAYNNVAMWPRNSINSMFQYNTISNTRRAPNTSDGQSMDADWWGVNNVYQYNTSISNQGGLALLCTNRYASLSNAEKAFISEAERSTRTIFRYNISINDGFNDNSLFEYNGDDMNAWFVHCLLRPEGIQIYNNVFYLSGNARNFELTATVYPNLLQRADFLNNIFYATSGITVNMRRGHGGIFSQVGSGDPNRIDFRANTMYGIFTNRPGHFSNAVRDPLLVGPFSSVYGFVPTSVSPSLGTGVVVADNGGKDFEGNPVSSVLAPNRGVFEIIAPASPLVCLADGVVHGFLR